MTAAGLGAGTWAAVLVLASLSAATSWIGVVLALRLGDRPAAVAGGLGFSTGIMLLIVGAELVPESYQTGGLAAVAVGIGLGGGAMAVLHVVLPHVHLLDEAGAGTTVRTSTASLVAVGLILHDLPEGFAMANAYVAASDVGVLVAVAIALHNIPEEFAMAVPAAALRRRRFLIRAAVVSALAEPVGAVVGLSGVALYRPLHAGFLAFAAGAMIYVSLHELFPLARRVGQLRQYALGAATAVPVYAVLHLLIT